MEKKIKIDYKIKSSVSEALWFLSDKRNPVFRLNAYLCGISFVHFFRLRVQGMKALGAQEREVT